MLLKTFQYLHKPKNETIFFILLKVYCPKTSEQIEQLLFTAFPPFQIGHLLASEILPFLTFSVLVKMYS